MGSLLSMPLLKNFKSVGDTLELCLQFFTDFLLIVCLGKETLSINLLANSEYILLVQSTSSTVYYIDVCGREYYKQRCFNVTYNYTVNNFVSLKCIFLKSLNIYFQF